MRERHKANVRKPPANVSFRRKSGHRIEWVYFRYWHFSALPNLQTNVWCSG